MDFPLISCTNSSPPRACYMPCRPNRSVQVTKLLIMQFSPRSGHVFSLRFRYSPQPLQKITGPVSCKALRVSRAFAAVVAWQRNQGPLRAHIDTRGHSIVIRGFISALSACDPCGQDVAETAQSRHSESTVAVNPWEGCSSRTRPS
jgi:hypothetical protein